MSQDEYTTVEVSIGGGFGQWPEPWGLRKEVGRLKKEFGLDESESLVSRVKVSKLVVAWEAAKARTTKLAEMDWRN